MNMTSTRTLISGTPLCTGDLTPGAAVPPQPDTSSNRKPQLCKRCMYPNLMQKGLGCENQRLFLYERSTKPTNYNIYLQTSATCCIFISPGRKSSSMFISVRHIPFATSLGHRGESLAQRCHNMPTATCRDKPAPRALPKNLHNAPEHTELLHGTKSKVCAE